jgi:hypothetical protein
MRLSSSHFVVLLCCFVLVASSVTAQSLCQTWTEQRVGNLDVSLLDEASGMAASAIVQNRLYHTNDTWSPSPAFFISDTAGQGLQSVGLEGLTSKGRLDDIEDMDVGTCGNASCLFIGDIGDNLSGRTELRLLVVEEVSKVPTSVVPKQILHVQYPDRAHDAESLAVHPNGDIFILTKEGISLLGTPAAKLYKLSRAIWENAGDEVLTLEYVGSIDLRTMSSTTVNVFSHIATGMDISSDGQRLLILTYGEVFEIAVDVSQLAGQTLSTETAYKQIEVTTLLQQESISYAATGYSFFYTAEARSGSAPLMLETCVDTP